MKKTSLITVLLFLTIFVNGQVNKLSIGIAGSPDFYNYQFKSIPGFDHEFGTKTNCSVGLSVNYDLAQKFSLKTGLFYSTKGYRIDYSWISSEPGDPLIFNESIRDVSYLDIPVLISYDFYQPGKLTFFASTGIITSFLINENETATMGDGTEKEIEFSKNALNQHFNKILFAPDLEIGLRYNLCERLVISTAPYIRYGLNKLSDELLESNTISYGVRLGVQYVL